jgi:transcription initiation factor TFIIH subunit 1
MGAASSNDIFSRKEIELKKRQQQTDGNVSASASCMSMSTQMSTSAAGQRQQRIAVGQFDLTATANTERGSKLLLNSNDLHPFDDRGKKVIEKYNRHWAMVLNPNDATAGCDLTDLAKHSALHVLEDDDDAKVNGGFGREMKRLVGFANADHDHVDHVKGMGRSHSNTNRGGDGDDYDDETEPVLFEELKLRNVDAYAGKNVGTDVQTEDTLEMDKKDVMFSQFALDQVKKMVQPLIDSKGAEGSQNSIYQVGNTFPHPSFGAKLLMSLTDRMVKDAMTEKDTVKMTKSLPEDFRKRLTSYTRRSDELLRHFFALRHVMEQEKKANGGGSSSSNGNQSSQKLKRIVQGMEDVFRELEEMRKSFPQAELGERMRKMCKPIMDQLDSAFVLNKDSSRSGGGFVDIQ